jgi:uncharacterized protein
MSKETTQRCTAFEGHRRIASGELIEVARKVKEVIDRGEKESILIFDDSDSEIVEIDFRGSVDEVVAKLETPVSEAKPAEKPETAPRGPGRPKLGVVSREVTLLPRHWDWLNSQPGGASVTLRKLVEEARRVNSGRDKVRRAQEVTYRFMHAIAGDLPGFEEATRALYARDRERFTSLIDAWPPDIRDHVQKLCPVVWE